MNEEEIMEIEAKLMDMSLKEIIEWSKTQEAHERALEYRWYRNRALETKEQKAIRQRLWELFSQHKIIYDFDVFEEIMPEDDKK